MISFDRLRFSADCSWPVLVSPIQLSPAYGVDTQPGTIAQPISFLGAAQTATAGAVVCLLGGRYELPCTVYIQNSGTSSAWITFKNFGDGDVLMVWKGGLTCGDFPMIKLDSTRAGAQATSYVPFIRLTLDGQDAALDGFVCVSNHDLRFSGNVIRKHWRRRHSDSRL